MKIKEKVLGLISGGIDSPVASVLAARRFEVIPLHLCLYPMSSQESFLKSIEALRLLREKISFEKAIIFPWAKILTEINEKIRKSYACVACRRCMLMVGEEICERENAKGIVTGESLGQKASQTIENILATSSGIDVPLIRPVFGMNKNEIIEFSKRLGIWRADHAGCCLATPRKPRTKAKTEELGRELRKMDIKGKIKKSEKFLLELEDLDQNFDSYLFRLAAEFE